MKYTDKLARAMDIINNNLEEIDRVTRLTVKMLEDRNYPVTYEGVYYNVCLWRVAKDDLITLFSKHPNWNPKSYMVAFDTDWERHLNTQLVYEFYDWIRETIYNWYDYGDLDDPEAFMYFRRKFYDWITPNCYSTFLSEQEVSNITAGLHEIIEHTGDVFFNIPAPKVGMKTSRWINKLCLHIGVTEEEDYESKYADLADALNPIIVKRHTAISLNFIDFLLSSNGNSGWRSCHSIDVYGENPGGYSAGTISYALDTCSFVLYTVGREYNGDRLELQKKITRNMFAYQDYKLLQQRVYPQKNDGDDQVFTAHRKVVQKVIADCLGEPDLWIMRGGYDAQAYCKEGIGALNYQDWKLQDFSKTTISFLNGKDSMCNHSNPMFIGATPYAVNAEGVPLTNGGLICI